MLEYLATSTSELKNDLWAKGNIAQLNWLYDVTYLSGCMMSYTLLRNSTTNSSYL